MSMSASSKKSISLSASDRSRLVFAEKVLHASKHIPTSNPYPANISDRQTVLDEGKLLVTRAEGYSLTFKTHTFNKKLITTVYFVKGRPRQPFLSNWLFY